MTNLGYLFAGFTLVWGVAFVYVWYLSRRSRRIEEKLERLERRLEGS